MLIRADVIFAAGYVRSVPPSDPLVTFALDQHGTDTDPDLDLDSAKEALAENQSCPAGLLDRLGSDPNRYVRMAVVSNLKCPPAVRGRALEGLLQDPDPDVARWAADQPDVPRAALAMWQLATNDQAGRPDPP
jgi:hypothetical protein